MVTVRLEPGGAEFGVAEDETVLVAAERQGLRLRYGCRHGKCSACKYQMLEGDVDQPEASIYSLSDAEREEGWALVCCAYPVEDLVLLDDAPRDPRLRPLLVPTAHEVEVREVEDLPGGLVRLVTSRPDRFDFYAGQFVEVTGGPMGIGDGIWRPYSIASSPVDDDRLEFLVKRIPGGLFSGSVAAGWVGHKLGVRGPFGDAYLRDGTEEIVLVGTGSGLAPLLSIVRAAASSRDPRRIRLFYGARTRADLTVLEAAEGLTDVLELDVVACLSQPSPDDGWEGMVGRVTRAVQRGVGDASTIDGYVCGHPDMCAEVLTLLEAKGIAEHHIFTDEFHPATS